MRNYKRVSLGFSGNSDIKISFDLDIDDRRFQFFRLFTNIEYHERIKIFIVGWSDVALRNQLIHSIKFFAKSRRVSVSSREFLIWERYVVVDCGVSLLIQHDVHVFEIAMIEYRWVMFLITAAIGLKSYDYPPRFFWSRFNA